MQELERQGKTGGGRNDFLVGILLLLLPVVVPRVDAKPLRLFRKTTCVVVVPLVETTEGCTKASAEGGMTNNNNAETNGIKPRYLRIV